MTDSRFERELKCEHQPCAPRFCSIWFKTAQGQSFGEWSFCCPWAPRGRWWHLFSSMVGMKDEAKRQAPCLITLICPRYSTGQKRDRRHHVKVDDRRYGIVKIVESLMPMRADFMSQSSPIFGEVTKKLWLWSILYNNLWLNS